MEQRKALAKMSVLAVLLGACLFTVLSLSSTKNPALSLAPLDLFKGVAVVGIGLIVGCYGTIVGIGGGPIIMPVLILLFGWKTEVLVGTCLFVVFLNAFSGSIGYARQGRVDFVGGIKFSLAAIPGALLGGWFHHLFDVKMFDHIFGVFLLLLVFYTCATIDRIDEPRTAIAPGSRRVRIHDIFNQKFEFLANDNLGIKISLVLGVLSGFLGIGGGVLQVPVLLYLLCYPPHIATATSHFVTMMTCAAALIPHLALGNIFFGKALLMGGGVMVGAQVGARLAPRISSQGVIWLYVGVLLVFAFRLIVS